MIYNENNLETLKRLEDNIIDLVVTSPPYDNLREYESFVDSELFVELYRTIKDGGVLCWNVFDAKNDSTYSGSSMTQALELMEVGFNLHQYLIYEKNSVAFPQKAGGKLYTNIFEFVFVFSKGEPKTVNLICDKKNKWGGQTSYDGKVNVKEYGVRNSIWKYTTSQNDKTDHPAVMPEKLAADLIKSYSNEGDLVYDPYLGSGTTAKMAHLLNRTWFGSEISRDYVDIANKRINSYISQINLF